ncbi:hypothetical protein X757_02860 [Mesorhizobium sp. LSHC414A00]|nr:hypothetical protein X757_02860 [Mesorhizobium sp. LSHC414A00]
MPRELVEVTRLTRQNKADRDDEHITFARRLAGAFLADAPRSSRLLAPQILATNPVAAWALKPLGKANRGKGACSIAFTRWIAHGRKAEAFDPEFFLKPLFADRLLIEHACRREAGIPFFESCSYGRDGRITGPEVDDSARSKGGNSCAAPQLAEFIRREFWHHPSS